MNAIKIWLQRLSCSGGGRLQRSGSSAECQATGDWVWAANRHPGAGHRQIL